MLKVIRIEHVFTKKLLFYHQDMVIQNKIVKLSLNAYPLPPLFDVKTKICRTKYKHLYLIFIRKVLGLVDFFGVLSALTADLF